MIPGRQRAYITSVGGRNVILLTTFNMKAALLFLILALVGKFICISTDVVSVFSSSLIKYSFLLMVTV